MGDVGKGRWTKVGRFLVPKCEVPNAIGGSGLTPLRGRSRLSKVHQGGVQRQAGPSDTKESGPLRNCQTDRCARLDRGLGRVSQAATRAGQVGLRHTPRPPEGSSPQNGMPPLRCHLHWPEHRSVWHWNPRLCRAGSMMTGRTPSPLRTKI